MCLPQELSWCGALIIAVVVVVIAVFVMHFVCSCNMTIQHACGFLLHRSQYMQVDYFHLQFHKLLKTSFVIFMLTIYWITYCLLFLFIKFIQTYVWRDLRNLVPCNFHSFLFRTAIYSWTWTYSSKAWIDTLQCCGLLVSRWPVIDISVTNQECLLNDVLQYSLTVEYYAWNNS